MPEGDTIFRAARTLRSAIGGAEVTDIATTVPQVLRLGPRRLVGQHVAEVESRGKHLLIWFAPSDLALHSHMRMTGSWHVYGQGEPWHKPQAFAKVVLRFAGVVAVCFSAPVVALLSRSQVERHPALSALGPDALDPDADLAEARRRLDERRGWTIGEALLDQRVLAGVGNVYKSEVCFLHIIDPWTPVGLIDAHTRDAVLATAARLLRSNATRTSPMRVTTAAIGPGRQRLHVYGRARRPCPRCATPIRAARQGQPPRLTYWCPRCQGPGPDAAANHRADRSSDLEPYPRP